MKGQYFACNFSAEAHKSADNLRWFYDIVTENVAFWNLQPAFHTHVAYGEIKGPNAGTFIFDSPEAVLVHVKKIN